MKTAICTYKTPLHCYDGGKTMSADVSDLPPGMRHYYVFGFAGKEKFVPWISLGGTFFQE